MFCRHPLIDMKLKDMRDKTRQIAMCSFRGPKQKKGEKGLQCIKCSTCLLNLVILVGHLLNENIIEDILNFLLGLSLPDNEINLNLMKILCTLLQARSFHTCLRVLRSSHAY